MSKTIQPLDQEDAKHQPPNSFVPDRIRLVSFITTNGWPTICLEFVKFLQNAANGPPPSTPRYHASIPESREISGTVAKLATCSEPPPGHFAFSFLSKQFPRGMPLQPISNQQDSCVSSAVIRYVGTRCHVLHPGSAGRVGQVTDI